MAKDLRKQEKLEQRIIALMLDGVPGSVIARKLARNDPRAAASWRRRIRRLAARSQEYQMAQAELSQGIMTLALPGVTDALVRRAMRGRPDAIKLLFEASGFHNPRIKHEHSGDIKLTLDLPRPGVASPPGLPEPVVDADVIEE